LSGEGRNDKRSRAFDVGSRATGLFVAIKESVGKFLAVVRQVLLDANWTDADEVFAGKSERSIGLSRCFHLRTVQRPRPYRRAKALMPSGLAAISARTACVVRAFLCKRSSIFLAFLHFQRIPPHATLSAQKTAARVKIGSNHPGCTTYVGYDEFSFSVRDVMVRLLHLRRFFPLPACILLLAPVPCLFVPAPSLFVPVRQCPCQPLYLKGNVRASIILNFRAEILWKHDKEKIKCR
jgi:hypothetical protein